MTIARRRATTLPMIGAPSPAPTASPPATRPLALPVSPLDVPAPDAVAPVGRLRRCTFRRIDRVAALPGRASLSAYEVMCLYVDRESPLALGDVSAAQPVCEACTATGIFRPDES